MRKFVPVCGGQCVAHFKKKRGDALAHSRKIVRIRETNLAHFSYFGHQMEGHFKNKEEKGKPDVHK